MTDTSPNFDPVEWDRVILIDSVEWERHKNRVELLVTIIGGVMEAASTHPIFGGMIPEELIMRLSELQTPQLTE